MKKIDHLVRKPLLIRTASMSLLTVLVVSFFTYILFLDQKHSLEKQVLVEQLRLNKSISQETGLFFSGLRSDIDFFKSLIELGETPQSIERIALGFLSSHKTYFKMRLINSEGKEIFKLKKDEAGKIFSPTLADVSEENFYKKLKDIPHDKYYMSSFDLNQTNNVVDQPLRPTVRLARRVFSQKLNKEFTIILNMDASVLLNEFKDLLVSQNLVTLSIVNDQGLGILYSDNGFAPDNILKGVPVSQQIMNYIKNAKESSFDVIDHFGVSSMSNMITDLSGDMISGGKYFLHFFTPKDVIQTRLDDFTRVAIICDGLLIILLLTLIYKFEQRRFRSEISVELLRDQEYFIAHVSHQLKTPLSIMSNEIDEALNGQNHNRLPIVLQSMKEEISYLVKVVDNLLILSRINTIPDSISMRPIRIDEILINIISRLSYLSREKEIKINLRIDSTASISEESLIINGDEQLIRCMFENLIENAIKYSPRNSMVEIDVSVTEKKLIVSIRDWGKGINSENSDKIFNYFYRESSDGKGAGLGLALSQKIAVLHRGEINYLPAKDKGSIFKIQLAHS